METSCFALEAKLHWMRQAMGRERGCHTPVLTKNSDGSVTVKVNYVMVAADGEKDDHIEYVYARDLLELLLPSKSSYLRMKINHALHLQKVQAQLHLQLLQQARMWKGSSMRKIISSRCDRHCHCSKYQWFLLRKPTTIRVISKYFFCIR